MKFDKLIQIWTQLAELDLTDENHGMKEARFLSEGTERALIRSEYAMEKSTPEQRANHGWITIWPNRTSRDQRDTTVAYELTMLLRHGPARIFEKTDNAVNANLALRELLKGPKGPRIRNLSWLEGLHALSFDDAPAHCCVWRQGQQAET